MSDQYGPQDRDPRSPQHPEGTDSTQPTPQARPTGASGTGEPQHVGAHPSGRASEHTAPMWFGDQTPYRGGPQGGQPGWGAPPPAPRPQQRQGTGRRWAELVAVAAVAAVLASGGTYAATNLGDDGGTAPASAAAGSSSSSTDSTSSAPVVQADPNNPNWTATANAVSPSVVAITVRQTGGEAQGSGVVYDDNGHILTNNHVVQGGQTGQIQVTLNDGRTYPATIAGTDPSTDLAVLTVKNPPSDLKQISLGNSDELAVGDPVMAIGNPLGLSGTVTTGIVSALNRPVTTGAQQQDPFQQRQSEPVVTNAIQTSAAINPGNSGGALVNADGQLVGINSSIASLGSTGGESGSIGIGFAIPVNEAKAIASQLIDTGSAQHAYLGVAPKDGTASDGTATRTGAEIARVLSGTPAAKAGLKQGDLVVAVDGERVDSATSLVAAIRERQVGDQVTLTVLRDGSTQKVSATLVARSGS